MSQIRSPFSSPNWNTEAVPDLISLPLSPASSVSDTALWWSTKLCRLINRPLAGRHWILWLEGQFKDRQIIGALACLLREDEPDPIFYIPTLLAPRAGPGYYTSWFSVATPADFLDAMFLSEEIDLHRMTLLAASLPDPQFMPLLQQHPADIGITTFMQRRAVLLCSNTDFDGGYLLFSHDNETIARSIAGADSYE